MNKYNNEVDLRRVFLMARKLWWLYALAFLVLGGVAGYYCYSKLPRYQASSSLLIEDSSTGDGAKGAGSMMTMMRAFNVGGFGAASVDNEVFLVTSRDVMIRTVRDMKMNRVYVGKDGAKKQLLYPECPVEITAPEEFFDTLSVGFKVKIELLGNGKADIKAFKGRFIKKNIGELRDTSLPCALSTVYGELGVSATKYFDPKEEGSITVTVMGNELAAADLEKNIEIDVPNKLADGIGLAYYGGNRKYVAAVLNALMKCYNDKRIERKHQTAAEEVAFYDARINSIFSELSEAESKVEKFKNDNKIYGISQEASILIGDAYNQTVNIAQAKAKREYYQEVKKALSSGDGSRNMIPVKEGFGDTGIETYNQLILSRNNLERSAKADNPALIAINKDIADMRDVILRNVDNVLLESDLTIGMMQNLAGTSKNRLEKIPSFERIYTNLERDKELKNELYLFLLEKRESAALSMTSTASLGFIVDPAYADLKPTMKKEMLIMLIALCLAIVGPSMIVMLLVLRNGKVTSAADINYLGDPGRTFNVQSGASYIKKIRSMLLNIPEKNNVYVLNLSSESDFAARLQESLLSIGKSVNLVSGIPDNDSIFKAPMKKDCDYNLVEIPEKDNLGEIASLINADDARLLVLVSAGTIPRSSFRQMLKGLDCDNITVGVVK